MGNFVTHADAEGANCSDRRRSIKADGAEVAFT